MGMLFWSVILGELAWHAFDLVTDVLFYRDRILRDDFQHSAPHADAVAHAALALLALNAAYLCVSQWYVVRTKRRIRRASLQKDPTYVARMARVQFALLAGTFALEDLPSLVVFTYVEARVGGFDGIAQLQLGSSLAGCAFFLYLAYRRRVRGQRARSEAQRATVRQDRSLWAAVLTAFRTDVRDRDLLASATRGAAAHAVGEPRRAQHAKRAFDEGERAVAREMALT